ncbi:winged helix-turn-helix domain-containing protein [Pragia fontium]|uniref:winged helix-turn-helix domain-containing protein n=1 Tax=Pragia fontium TaxID=82985 RepID=UPI000649B3E1|nr:helix-turn-helix domain-containing protein [Pragia fontium]AKJ43425.1 hypothetical protein QQ39_16310 [Pragia fontium]
MECIINGIVKYNSDDGTLLSPDNIIDMIKLTRVVNELLLLFINNNHILLSRDTLLSELWEKRGLNSSSNNLSNYVSVLRKTLNKCGCPNLIVTVPKLGFVFEADITILAKIEEERPQSPVTKEEVVELPATEAVMGNKTRSFSWLKERMTLIVGVITLALFLWLPGVYEQWSLKSSRTEVLTIDQCKFYLTDDVTRGLDKDSATATIKTIVNNERLNCRRKANVYYFADRRMDATGQLVMKDLLTYCAYDGKAPCSNYYMSRYKNGNENKK